MAYSFSFNGGVSFGFNPSFSSRSASANSVVNGQNDTGEREARLEDTDSDYFLVREAVESGILLSVPDIVSTQFLSLVLGSTLGSNGNDTIVGTSEDDSIFGLAGNDDIRGGNGSDDLNGGDGDDLIRGGQGGDLLDGGKGTDTLIGGEGVDVFTFRKGDGTTIIEDFELGYDILDVEHFDNLTYEDLTAAGTQVGDDVLIIRNADLATMTADDLCINQVSNVIEA